MSNKENAGRDAALSKVLGDLDKQFGKGTIMRLTEGGVQDIEKVTTGSLNLDWALGGGIPRGKIVELFGLESAGKTTLVYHIIAEFQKAGGVCAFIDAEHAMDPVYAQSIGVDPEALLVSQPDYGEQALEIADQLARSGAVDLICIDSVAALTPRAELEGQMGDTTVGLQARMMGQAMRKLAGNLSRTNTACVFTNQIREKVGVVYGSPETQPGGKALKFFSSQRMKIAKNGQPHKGKDEHGNEMVIGNPTRVDVVKNKVAPPFKRAEFDIMFGTGIALEGEVLDRGVQFGILTKSGAFYSYGDTRLGQGRTNAIEFLRENTAIRDEVADVVRIKLGMTPDPEADFRPDPEDQVDEAALAGELGVSEAELEKV